MNGLYHVAMAASRWHISRNAHHLSNPNSFNHKQKQAGKADQNNGSDQPEQKLEPARKKQPPAHIVQIMLNGKSLPLCPLSNAIWEWRCCPLPGLNSRITLPLLSPNERSWR